MPAAASPERIGLIGAGLMGTALAERLCAAGFHLLVWDLDPARMSAVSALGAAPAADAPAIAAACTRIILSLPDSPAVASVLAAIEPSLRPGAIILDTTTGEPAETLRLGHELETRGISYLDAPFSGSSEQVRRGEALCMVGGSAQAFTRCADVLAAFGGRSIHVGARGAGARLKLVTNLVLGLNRAALAEGLAFAEAVGLAPAKALEVLRSSAAYSRIMESKGDRMVHRDFRPVARLSQHLKDVRLMLRAAAEAEVKLPLSETHRTLLEQAEAAGWGEFDNSALIQVLRKAP